MVRRVARAAGERGAGAAVPARLAWAVELLDVRPDHRVLEIGCGTGVAAALLCERLSAGRLTAIDRSATAVAAAARRLREHVERGRAVVRHAALEDAPLDGERFDRVLAVNVNAFWTRPDRSFPAVRPLLAPGGALCLVYEPPAPERAPALADVLAASLARHGLELRRLALPDPPGVPALGLVATSRCD